VRQKFSVQRDDEAGLEGRDGYIAILREFAYKLAKNGGIFLAR